MSRQLAIASCFSIFALAAAALFAPQEIDGFASGLQSGPTQSGATIEIAAPAFDGPFLPGRRF